MKYLNIIFITLFSINVFSEQLKFAVIGDTGRWNSNAQLVLNSIKSFETQRLILPGDNLYTGTYEQQWGNWKKAGFTFDVVAIGNHHAGYANEVKYFGMPGEYFEKSYLEGAVQFLVLNSDNTSTVAAQMKWLEEQLKVSTAQQIFLVYHHPSLTIGEHLWTEKKDFQIKLRALIKNYRNKITAVMVGHEHLADLIYFDSLPVIVSGSTQSPDAGAAVNNVQVGIQVKTEIHLNKLPYWIQQVTEGGNTSEFVFIRAKDNKVMCKAVIQTGLRGTHSCARELVANN